MTDSQSLVPPLPRAKAHGWFILINALLAMLIALRYFAYVPAPEGLGEGLYFAAATFSQMLLLTGLVGLILMPLLLLPWPRLRRVLFAAAASLGLSLLVIDTLVFDQYRFHINAVVLDLWLSGEVISFPWTTHAMVGLGVTILFGLQYGLQCWLQRGPGIARRRWGRKITALAMLALLATHGTHIWAAAYGQQRVTSFSRFLPLFHPATANSFMRKHGLVDADALARQEAMKLKGSSTLQYPLQPMDAEPVQQPLDIVWIVVDSWRADTFNEVDTPNLWRFAQRGMLLNQHLSTGNATRAGIFGLFYGLPATYWHAFLGNQRSPLLLDRMQELNYQMGIFASAHLQKPEFNKTVFSRIPDLRLRSDGADAAERDLDVTRDWLAWYAARDRTRPSFSFLFYDAPHAYLFPADYPHKREPMVPSMNYLEFHNDYDPTPVFNRYRTSVHYVDSLARQVLDQLQAEGALERTLVLITGDHSQELNDNKLNFWGHNSNYTNAQVQVPFALVGPGITSGESWNALAAMTSHEDVAPTFLRHFLGVTSPIETYSTGKTLLEAPVRRPWLISSDYNSYGIISENAILELSMVGAYRLLDRQNRIKEGDIQYGNVQQALDAMSRFYK